MFDPSRAAALTRSAGTNVPANPPSSTAAFKSRYTGVFFVNFERRENSHDVIAQISGLVTGANKGIGFEVACALAKSRYVVLLGARNSTTGREAADTLTQEGLDVRFVELDVTRTEIVSAAAARIEAGFGKLDLLRRAERHDLRRHFG